MMNENLLLLNFFERYTKSKLTPEVETEILSHFKTNEYKKKTIIFSPGDVNTPHYFIEKGIVRMYLIDKQGKEINILFAREGHFIGDLKTPQATSFYLETIENSVISSTSESEFQSLGAKLSSIHPFDLNAYMRRSYIHIQNRLVSILSKSAEENYYEFKDSYPDLIQRIPQYLIAGYIGISPEFLSKLIAKTTKGL
jgi:CRP-like cAMP-binding protein